MRRPLLFLFANRLCTNRRWMEADGAVAVRLIQRNQFSNAPFGGMCGFNSRAARTGTA